MDHSRTSAPLFCSREKINNFKRVKFFSLQIGCNQLVLQVTAPLLHSTIDKESLQELSCLLYIILANDGTVDSCMLKIPQYHTRNFMDAVEVMHRIRMWFKVIRADEKCYSLVLQWVSNQTIMMGLKWCLHEWKSKRSTPSSLTNRTVGLEFAWKRLKQSVLEKPLDRWNQEHNDGKRKARWGKSWVMIWGIAQ